MSGSGASRAASFDGSPTLRRKSILRRPASQGVFRCTARNTRRDLRRAVVRLGPRKPELAEDMFFEGNAVFAQKNG